MSLETIIYLDVLRFKAVSLTLGIGGVINNTKGLKKSWNSREVVYFSNWYYAMYLGGGIRVNPKNSSFAYEFMPFNMHLGTNGYAIGYCKIGVEIKLR
jgi:hypothetical protein